MKFGNYKPIEQDNGNGLTDGAFGERHLYEFENGYGASVLVTTAAAVAQYPDYYPTGEEAVGTHELCVVSQGVPLAMLRGIFGIDLPDPLGETPNGVHVGLSEAEVTAMLVRLEAAEAVDIAA